MKIYFLSIFDLLRARTNQICDVRLCEAFAQVGCEVQIISPYVFRHDNIRKKDIFDVYGIEKPFRIKIMKTPFWESMPAWLSLPVLFMFISLATMRIFLTNFWRLSEVVIMSRSVDLLISSIVLKKLLLLQNGPLIVTHAHEVIYKSRYKFVYRACDAVVGTNTAITEDIEREIGVPGNRMEISLNPITEYQASHLIAREAARERLSIPASQRLVIYTGKLYVGQKEAEYILGASEALPMYHFLLTGGKPDVVAHYRRVCNECGIKNVSFAGFLQKQDDVRYYQSAADVLISYYSAYDHLTRYNLPNKICEYMLTGNPIVTCDFPATRDLLNQGNAVFVSPEDSKALADGIRHVFDHPENARTLGEQARRDVQEITYRKRAAILRKFFEGLQRNASCRRVGATK